MKNNNYQFHFNIASSKKRKHLHRGDAEGCGAEILLHEG